MAEAQALADVLQAACMASGEAMPTATVQGVTQALQRIQSDVQDQATDLDYYTTELSHAM